MKSVKSRDAGGLIGAVAMLALAAWVFWEAEGYSELAAVFPLTIALVLALSSVVLIIRCLLGLQQAPVNERGSPLRRGALVAVLAGWVAMIPVLGFATASFAGFLAAGMVGRYKHWSVRRWAAFVGLGLAAVGLLYGLFSKVLLVPFPQGVLL